MTISDDGEGRVQTDKSPWIKLLTFLVDGVVCGPKLTDSTNKGIRRHNLTPPVEKEGRIFT